MADNFKFIQNEDFTKSLVMKWRRNTKKKINKKTNNKKQNKNKKETKNI